MARYYNNMGRNIYTKRRIALDPSTLRQAMRIPTLLTQVFKESQEEVQVGLELFVALEDQRNKSKFFKNLHFS